MGDVGINRAALDNNLESGKEVKEEKDSSASEGVTDQNRAGIGDIFGFGKDGKKKAAKEKEEKEKSSGSEKKASIEEIGAPRVKRLSGESAGLIINNNFKGQGRGKELLGYNNDEENIKKTFSKFNIDFEVARNLKANKIHQTIRQWLLSTDFDDYDCSICFILTHGDDGGLLYGEDMRYVTIESIKSMFINCKGLYGKPKLFFIQACRGYVDSEVVAVSDVKTAGVKEVAKDADVFLFFPTAPGKTSWVTKEGSTFINTLCKVVQAYGGKYHLQDVVTKVNDLLSTNINTIVENGRDVTVVEVSETTHSLTYYLYFNDKDGDNKETLV